MAKTNIRVVGIDHVVLNVSNLERSKEFYMEVLGFEFRQELHGTARMAFLRCGSQGLDLREVAGAADGGAEVDHLALCVAAGERDEIVAELTKLGIEVEARDAAPATMYFSDPDGHRIQLLAISEQAKNAARLAAALSVS